MRNKEDEQPIRWLQAWCQLLSLCLTYLACRYLCLEYCIVGFCWDPPAACPAPMKCGAREYLQQSTATQRCGQSLLPSCWGPALSVESRLVACQLKQTQYISFTRDDSTTLEIWGTHCKGKGKIHPEAGYRHSSTLVLTSGARWGGLMPRSGRFLPGQPVSIVQEAGWVWTGAENIATPGFDPRIV